MNFCKRFFTVLLIYVCLNYREKRFAGTDFMDKIIPIKASMQMSWLQALNLKYDKNVPSVDAF